MKANVTYQNLGTNWLVILNGNENDVELAFNSFYNHGATSGELDWNATYNATFWTTPAKMKSYFYNRLRHLSPEVEKMVRPIVAKMIRKGASKSKHELQERAVRLLLHKQVKSQFDEFKANQKTDWNKKFGGDNHEYAVVHTPNNSNRDPDDFRDYMVTRGLQG